MVLVVQFHQVLNNMIVFDKYGYEHKIGINPKLKFDEFKKIFKDVPFDYEKIFLKLGGKPEKKKNDTGRTIKESKKDSK